MFNVSTSADFYKSIDPRDPLNDIAAETAAAAMVALSRQIDQFIRAAIKKAIPDDTLALFADDGKAIPGLDLRMELLSYRTKRVTVLFRDRELGHATFETRLVDMVGAQAVIHEMKDVSI